MYRRAALPLLLAAACVAPPPVARPETPLPGQGRAEQDLGGWRAFTRISPKRFRSRGHGQVWVDVFVDPAHADAYRARATPAPVGLRVVMAGFESEKGQPTGLTAMVKMSPGYDPDGGDWYYAALPPAGDVASTQGRLDLCAGCHTHVKDGDHLFGVVTGEPPPALPNANAGIPKAPP